MNDETAIDTYGAPADETVAPQIDDELTLANDWAPLEARRSDPDLYDDDGWSDEDWAAYNQDVAAGVEAIREVERQGVQADEWAEQLAFEHGFDPEDLQALLDEVNSTIEHGRTLKAEEEQAYAEQQETLAQQEAWEQFQATSDYLIATVLDGVDPNRLGDIASVALRLLDDPGFVRGNGGVGSSTTSLAALRQARWAFDEPKDEIDLVSRMSMRGGL